MKETLAEIDKVVKPLIESAAEEAGPVLGGLSRAFGAALGVVVELATAPATARDEDKLHQMQSAKKENTKDARPSTEEKHEYGQARKRKDRGGEKGDKRRGPPRKRPDGWKGPWPPRPGTNWW